MDPLRGVGSPLLSSFNLLGANHQEEGLVGETVPDLTRSASPVGSEHGALVGSVDDTSTAAAATVIKWESVTRNLDSTTMIPTQIGGFIIGGSDDKPCLPPFMGTDPDSKINIFEVDVSGSFDISKPTWVCNPKLY